MTVRTPKPRTPEQNKSLWLFYTLLADALNNAGLDMRVVLKPTYAIPWTKESVHAHLWLPIQKAMYSTDSTTKLPKLGQIDAIHATLMRELGEKFGLEYIEWPHMDHGEVDDKGRVHLDS